ALAEWLFCRHADIGDDCTWRADLRPRHELVDGCLLALGHELDRTVVPVRRRARDAEPGSLTIGARPEPNTLHATIDHDAAPHGSCHGVRTYTWCLSTTS